MGLIKKEYFIKILDDGNKLIALYSTDSLLCRKCAEEAGCESWKIDKNFAKTWIKPNLDRAIENSYAWCDKCGKTIWDSHEGRLLDELDDETEAEGWLNEIDDGDDGWLDEIVHEHEK